MTVNMKDMEERMKIQILETNITIEFMKTEEMTKTAATEKRINGMSTEIKKISLENLESSRTIKCMQNEKIRRFVEAEKWYRDELIDRVKLVLKNKNICEKFKTPVDDVVKEFDENFGLINKGLPWLREELKRIAARGDAAKS